MLLKVFYMYSFKINDFEGPLDVLLHLIKESKMDIMDIDVVSLTNQYLNFINSMEDNDITIASEYLTLASELIYLKSRYLLPQDKDEEDDVVQSTNVSDTYDDYDSSYDESYDNYDDSYDSGY